MILNKLYRLQRKKGAVLFVVIAMMTLLVIMATAAYMTARSSHQTVINNYDFSQVYLSTISVSDMMIGAITQDTVDNAATPNNNFANLKSIILDETNFGVGKSLKAKSSNIDDSWDTPEKILAGIANTTPVKNGILDAVQIVIDHESTITKDKLSGDPKDKSLNIDHYLITTTGYYRNNTITVQDRIAREWGDPADPDLFTTFFTATGKKISDDAIVDDLERCAVIDTHEISDDAYFENENTVFKNATTMNTFLGGMTASGNVWLEQFQCGPGGSGIPNASDTTPEFLEEKGEWGIQYKKDKDGNYILDANGEKIVDDRNQKALGTRNDWFVGGSLIFGGNAKSWKIGNNNLIVMGDLILAGHMNEFQANRVYVMGNLINLDTEGGTTFDCDLYVNGAIVTNIDTTTGSDEVKAIKENAKLTIDKVNTACKKTIATSKGKTPDEIGNITGFGNTGGTSDASTKLGTGKKLYLNDTTNSNTNLTPAGKFDTTKYVPVSYLQAEPVDNPTSYVSRVNFSKTIAQVGASETARSNYYPFTATAKTMGNTLTIDMDKSKLSGVYGGGSGTELIGYKGEFWVNGAPDKDEPDGNKATVEFTNINGDGEATISLPYVANGYVLELKFINSPPHKSMTYTIENKFTDVTKHPTPTNEDSLPIILKANFNDGSGNPDDKAYKLFADKPLDMKENPCEGNNAFAWNVNYEYNWSTGKSRFNLGNGDGSHFTKVIVNGAFDVFFELGNYDDTGAYKKFETGKGLNTATFWTNLQLEIGTANQLGAIPKPTNTANDLKTLLKSGMSDPQTWPVNYDNQVVIVSNKSGGVAYNNNRELTNLFGYIYAPFADYSNWEYVDPWGNTVTVSESAPVFGGMIVSNYTIMQSRYVFAEPDPQLMKNLEKALPKPDMDSGIEDIWYVNSDYGTGTNFLG